MAPTITDRARSLARAQRAMGRSPHTIRLYGVCIARLVPFVRAAAGTDEITAVTRRVLNDFYGTRAESVAPATVWTDWKCHRVFLGLCVDEGELTHRPADERPSMRGGRG
jgi:hypothetical protein